MSIMLETSPIYRLQIPNYLLWHYKTNNRYLYLFNKYVYKIDRCCYPYFQLYTFVLASHKFIWKLVVLRIRTYVYLVYKTINIQY